MMKEILRAGLEEWQLNAPETCFAQLEDFSERMVETNKVMNLTGITEPDEIAKKHFLDCIALLTAENLSGKRVIDVGCGAGFPGMPLKLVCTDCDITLLDSLGKRIKFLQSCIDDMGLTGVEAVHARAEEYARSHREQYDAAVSRAVAQLNVLTELSLPFVRVGGVFIAMKSRDTDGEIDRAQRAVTLLGGKIERVIDYTIPLTDITHRMVVIRKVKPTPAKYPRPFRKISAAPL